MPPELFVSPRCNAATMCRSPAEPEFRSLLADKSAALAQRRSAKAQKFADEQKRKD